MFRIRYIPDGRFVQKCSSMGWCAIILNRCLIPNNNPNDFKLSWALTKGKGHSYNTRKGAENFLNYLSEQIVKYFEIVEYGEK